MPYTADTTAWPVMSIPLRGPGWPPSPEPTLFLMTPSLVYTAWADIGGGSQTSRCQHGGMEVGFSSPASGAFPRHPPHVRCPEGLGRTSNHRLGVFALASDMVASPPHGLVPLSKHAAQLRPRGSLQ